MYCGMCFFVTFNTPVLSESSLTTYVNRLDYSLYFSVKYDKIEAVVKVFLYCSAKRVSH
jgi:hypothetical protein